MFRQFLYIIIFALLPFFGSAQLFAYEIKGRVADKNTGEAIAQAIVLVKGSRSNVYTNSKGEFTVKSEQKDPVLVIYMLGYNTFEVKASYENDQQIFYLQPSAFELEEVKVSGKAFVQVQENNNTTFIDFDFYDNFILALVLKGRAGKDEYIQLLKMDGTFLTEKKAPFSSDHLERDCLGNIQLFAGDSVYQVYYNYVSIELLDAIASAEYKKVMGTCVSFKDGNYFFRQSAYRGLKQIYTFINDAEPGKVNYFATVADSNAIRGFNQDYSINYFLERRKLYGDPPWDYTTIKENLDMLRMQLQLSADYLNLMRPVASEMFWTDSVPSIIDYSGQTKINFSSFNKSDTLNAFKKLKADSLRLPHNIDQRILKDEESGRIYFITKADKPVLYLFDPKKLSFEEKLKLNKFPFITETKIRGKKLFFLYRNTKEEKVRKLFIYKLGA